MTAPGGGGVIATVYVDILPRIKKFTSTLRTSLRGTQRDLRALDRELKPVEEGFRRIGAVATGLVPGLKLTRTSLLAVGGHAVTGGILATAASLTTMAGAVIVLPAAGLAAASVMGTLAIGLTNVGDALKKFQDPEKFAEKLELLGENARKTLGVLNEFRGDIMDFRNSIQDRLFAGMDEELRGLIENVLPMFETHFGNIADVINAAGKDLSAFVQSAETMADVQEIMDNTELAVVALRGALVPAAQVLRDIGVVGSRVLPEIASEVTTTTQRFATFIAIARATGQLEQWIRMGVEQLRQLGRIAANVFRIFIALTGAAQESGAGLLSTIEDMTDRLADFLSSTRGQNAIKDFLDNAREAGKAVLPVLTALADLFFMHIMPVLTTFATTVGPSVAGFFHALGDALDVAAPGIAVFAQGFATFIRSITPVLPLIGELVASVATFVGTLAAEAGPAIADVASAIASVLIPIFRVLTVIINALGPEFLKIVVVIGAVVAILGVLTTVVRGVITVTSLFAGGLQMLTAGTAKTQGGLRGMVSFLGGPWGIALGIATTALGLFLSTADDTTTKVNSLADAMINAEGSTKVASRAWVLSELESNGAAAAADTLGLNINDVIDAYMGVPGAAERVRTQISKNISTDLEYQEALKLIQEILKDGPGVYNAAIAAVDRKTDADYRGAGAVQFVTDALKIQKGVLEAVRQEEERQQNAKLASINSQLAYQNSLARTTEELADGARTLDINNQEGRDNLSVLSELAAAGARRVDDLRAQNVSTEVLNTAIKQNEDAILGLIQPFFGSAAAARKYAEDVGLIPKAPTVTPKFNDAEARARAANFNAYLDYVARDRVATIRFNSRGNAQAAAGLPTGGYDIATNAAGGFLPAGRWSWVGERGPELVRFSRSARVFSNDESMNMSRDVGALDSMTSYGGTGNPGAMRSSTGWQPEQLSATVNVQSSPEVHVYVDGKEVRAIVRTEIDENNRKLVQLVDIGTGRRT